jgi:hypothetical protein
MRRWSRSHRVADHITGMTLMCCGECGIAFAIPDNFYTERRESRPLLQWFCPNGHPRVFKESEADRLRRERDRLTQQLAEKNDAIAERDRKLKRLAKRAAAGTCPCCQRTFSNMTRHMKTKHPEMVAENVVKLKARR